MARRWAGTILVVLFCAGSWACEGFSWDTGNGQRDRGEPYEGPRGRTAIGADVLCYDTFDQFKRAMKKQGKKKSGHQWHHIVAQHPGNKNKFGERNLHCTDNLVQLSKEDHGMINGFYGRKDALWENKSFRDFLRDKDFAEQYVYGCNAMRDKHVEYTEPACL